MDEFAANLTIDVSAGRYGVVALAVVVAGVTDALWLRIPNVLTIPLIVSGVLYHMLLPAGGGVLFAAVGACCGLGILLLLFAAGGVGAGDVKLLAGVGAWIGAHDVLVVFVVAALLNGICSVVLITWTRSWREVPWRIAEAFRTQTGEPGLEDRSVEHGAQQDGRTSRKRLVPMGTMIACALMILLVRDYTTSSQDGRKPLTVQVPAALTPPLDTPSHDERHLTWYDH